MFSVTLFVKNETKKQKKETLVLQVEVHILTISDSEDKDLLFKSSFTFKTKGLAQMKD